jgi:predicted transglutaminase-like cysteine proteinase
MRTAQAALMIAMMPAALLAAPVGAQTTQVAPPTAAGPADRSQEIVCKRERETGSLVKAKKTCLTRQQWQYVQDTNQQFARELNNATMSRPGGQ